VPIKVSRKTKTPRIGWGVFRAFLGLFYKGLKIFNRYFKGNHFRARACKNPIFILSAVLLLTSIPFACNVMSLTSALQYGQANGWLEMDLPHERQCIIIGFEVYSDEVARAEGALFRSL